MLILYVREIAIKIRILMFISNILRALCTFCPLNVSYYQKCSQTMAKWNGNERQISFGPKYLLKLIRYTVKNVIKNLDILFKSSFKMQEMPFKRLELQIFSKEACPLNPLEMCRQFIEFYPQIVKGKNHPDVEVVLRSKHYPPLWQRGKPWEKKTPGTH